MGFLTEEELKNMDMTKLNEKEVTGEFVKCYNSYGNGKYEVTYEHPDDLCPDHTGPCHIEPPPTNSEMFDRCLHLSNHYKGLFEMLTTKAHSVKIRELAGKCLKRAIRWANLAALELEASRWDETRWEPVDGRPDSVQ